MIANRHPPRNQPQVLLPDWDPLAMVPSGYRRRGRPGSGGADRWDGGRDRQAASEPSARAATEGRPYGVAVGTVDPGRRKIVRQGKK